MPSEEQAASPVGNAHALGGGNRAGFTGDDAAAGLPSSAGYYLDPAFQLANAACPGATAGLSGSAGYCLGFALQRGSAISGHFASAGYCGNRNSV